MDEIRFADLFSGIGGFALGLEKANNRLEKNSLELGVSPRDRSKSETFSTGKEERTGYFRCVWSCDNDKHANQVYSKQFGGENHYSGDIRRVDPRGIPDFDLLCAGFPCQSFSVAGKREGFQDTRGTLFFEICRIAEAKRPTMLLLENVRGLLSNDRGQTFQTILQELGRIGYWAEWQVLNSKHFGVPQNRERVFIVGHLRGTGEREIFPIKESDRSTNKGTTGKQGKISKSLTIENTSKQSRRGTYIIDTFNKRIREGEACSLKTNPSPTSSAIILRWQNLKDGVVTDEIAPTLRSSGGTDIRKKPAVIKDFRIRRLTPVECERLQGFPDGWTSHGICEKGDIVWTGKYRTRVEVDEDGLEVMRYHPIMTKATERGVYPLCDTPRYKCLGNAVTVNVVEFLGMRIRNIKSDNVREVR